MTLRERFLSKVEVPRGESDCWRWIGYVGPTGYGFMQTGRRGPSGHHAPDPAHRISYELHVGPIPDGLQIDHLCRNRSCVNPEHLDVVTGQENMLRAFDATCRRGHVRTEVNTYVDPNGYRRCRDCRRDAGW